MKDVSRIYCIVGPTASGKTALSVELAHLLGGPQKAEIISADAMQLYRGMDIGTAKATPAERRGIVHRQLDVLDIAEEASVAAYQRAARKDLGQIAENGKIPIVVGGSGLYVSALLDELHFPGSDPEVRSRLQEICRCRGLEPLVEELRKIDPVSAGIIDLANPRRVIRALEVVKITGRSYTPKFPRHTSHYANVVYIGISAEKEELNRRIEKRARKMFAAGLAEETERLIARGLRESPTAAKATGYAQALALLQGEISQDEAIEQTAFYTRRLAKKQRTWFGADKRIAWYEMSDPRELAERIIRPALRED